MNPKRKAVLELQKQREEQMKRREAEASAPVAGPRRVEVTSSKPVHDGLGGKYESGAVVTETAGNSAAIDAWLARGWARITT